MDYTLNFEVAQNTMICAEESERITTPGQKVEFRICGKREDRFTQIGS